MSTHREMIVQEALERLEEQMALGQRHSVRTRHTYQQQVGSFVTWARSTHDITSLEHLDKRADELASEYLREHICQKKSPCTLLTERSALRFYFANRQLCSEVTIPRRQRSKITRSRGPVKQDRDIQLANWQPLIGFVQATGLCRRELRDLKCHDIEEDHGGRVSVRVRSGRGALERCVPVLPGHEADVLAVKAGRDPDAPAFERIPKQLDVQSYRREFAQALYLHHAPGRVLPPTTGRLRPSDYDRAAAQQVSWALGLRRLSLVLSLYLR